MPAPQRNKWAEWREIAQQRIEAWRVGFEEWRFATREQPELIWQTPAVRYVTYGTAGLIAVLVLRWGIGLVQPTNPKNFQPRASTAHFNVVCTNPACGTTFVIERKFRFDDFPVKCPKCGQLTGQRAMRCHSATCGGRLVPVTETDGGFKCMVCGAAIGPSG